MLACAPLIVTIPTMSKITKETTTNNTCRYAFTPDIIPKNFTRVNINTIVFAKSSLNGRIQKVRDPDMITVTMCVVVLYESNINSFPAIIISLKNTVKNSKRYLLCTATK